MTEFRFGKVLGTGFACWLKNIVPFLLVTVVVYSPIIAYMGVTLRDAHDVEEIERVWETFNFIHGVGAPLLNILVASALTYGVVKELSGEHAPMWRCIGAGLARFFPALGVAPLVMLAIVGCALLVGVPVYFVTDMLGPAGNTIGAIMIIVPVVMVMCMLYVACNVAVIERRGLLGALARSRDLTAGARWKIFGIIAVLGVLNYLLETLVERTVLHEPETLEQLTTMLQKHVYLSLTRTVAIGSLSAVMTAVAYYYLRRAKEGTSAGELALVFE